MLIEKKERRRGRKEREKEREREERKGGNDGGLERKKWGEDGDLY